MNIGILSDTHDNLPLLRKGVEYLNAKQVDYVIHGGDYVAPFAARLLLDLQMPWVGIFGNNDGEREGLRKMSQGRIHEDPYRLELAGKKILITHFLKDPEVAGKFDLVVSGHTHQPQVEKVGSGLIVNPGECCAYLTGKSTLALVDLASVEAEIIGLG